MNIMKRSRLDNFKQFLENTMSGAGSPGSGAPFFEPLLGGNMGYGHKSPSNSPNFTTITYGGKIWMLEDYLDLYQDFINSSEYLEYLKGEKNGNLRDFNLQNIQTILNFKKS